jgi:hypothetical protein
VTEPVNERLHWSGRFADPAAEADYREARLPADRALGHTLVASLAALNLVFILLDLLSIGPTAGVLGSVAVKAVVIGWCGLGWWAVGRATRPDQLDRRLLAWVVPAVVLDVGCVWLHTPGHLGAATGTAVAVTLGYVLPLPLRGTAAVGLLATTLFLALLFGHASPQESAHGRRAAVVGFLLANALGAAAGRMLRADRRRLYAASTALGAAATELQTLRGLLPICGFCKKIRDPAGDWQRLEKYIQDRTDARFTHGVCPDCLTSEYGLTLRDGDLLTTHDGSGPPA